MGYHLQDGAVMSDERAVRFCISRKERICRECEMKIYPGERYAITLPYTTVTGWFATLYVKARVLCEECGRDVE